MGRLGLPAQDLPLQELKAADLMLKASARRQQRASGLKAAIPVQARGRGMGRELQRRRRLQRPLGQDGELLQELKAEARTGRQTVPLAELPAPEGAEQGLERALQPDSPKG